MLTNGSAPQQEELPAVDAATEPPVAEEAASAGAAQTPAESDAERDAPAAEEAASADAAQTPAESDTERGAPAAGDSDGEDGDGNDDDGDRQDDDDGDGDDDDADGDEAAAAPPAAPRGAIELPPSAALALRRLNQGLTGSDGINLRVLASLDPSDLEGDIRNKITQAGRVDVNAFPVAECVVALQPVVRQLQASRRSCAPFLHVQRTSCSKLLLFA